MKPGNSNKDLLAPTRKVVERALILPLIGLLLLIPPIASIFEIDSRLSGIPFTLLYLFFVWAVLIVAAARLSSRLQNLDDREPDQETETTESTESQQ